MVNFHTNIVSTLKTILPTHYELVLHKGLKTPCISYMQLDNPTKAKGDTLEYSSIQYQIKVLFWHNIINSYILSQRIILYIVLLVESAEKLANRFKISNILKIDIYKS